VACACLLMPSLLQTIDDECRAWIEP
jgi:hypothetical protein